MILIDNEQLAQMRACKAALQCFGEIFGNKKVSPETIFRYLEKGKKQNCSYKPCALGGVVISACENIESLFAANIFQHS